jgi:type VI secretion system protein ImpF
MAELTTQERLQPSLLDRLTDNEPEKSAESREQRVLSLARLRECVVRDLTWLLNTERMPTSEKIEDHPDAQQSVINFGIPSLTGSTSGSGLEGEALEKAVLDAIHAFEPRLIRGTVSIKTVRSREQMNLNALTFQIEADLWAQPVPLHLYLQTEVDLETGHFSSARYLT